jgi:translation initiation factor IF-2
MVDSSNKNKDALKLTSPSTLSLTKTVESGKVRQNFQRGRSKTVTVEVKKTRTFARGNGGVVEVDRGASDAKKQRMISQAEREARLKALQQADAADDDALSYKVIKPTLSFAEDKPEESTSEADIAQSAEATETTENTETAEKAPATAMPADDLAMRNLRALKDAPSNRNTAPAAEAKGPAAAKRPAAVKRGNDAPEKAAAPKKSKLNPEERRSGKLTIAQALGMDDENRMRSLASVRRQRAKIAKKSNSVPSSQQEKFSREVTIPENITVQDLANRMAERTVDVIRELMKLGTIATPHQAVDADTAELICEAFNHTAKRVSEADVEDQLLQNDDDEADMKPRPPVVTIMGHVDHGKTSLLDALREKNVVAGEAGGITQHIGAYQVALPGGEKVTFLDTPGHEAFTAMRARGAKVTDIVVLVVAADDGIMPQTKEAINHAKSAGVPIIVAVNKIDKPDADPSKVKNELMQYELVPEEFGGDIMTVDISALQKLNLDKLLEAIMLQAEMMELKANPSRRASGTVIEARVDRGRGTVATLLVQRGSLKTGDIVVAGSSYGRVRVVIDDQGKQLKMAGPSMPVEILGFAQPPLAGDEFAVVENEKSAREITEYRQEVEKKRVVQANAKSVDQLFVAAGVNATRELNIIIKGDVQGSVEAIIASLARFDSDEVKARIIHSGAGAINESDITLAQATGAMILAFNVRAMPKAKEQATAENTNIRYYSVIYQLIDDVKAALSGLLSPELHEDFIGYAEIREVFNITKAGKVAGCMITDGIVKRGAKVRLLRDNVVIHEGMLKTLKRFKEEVKEVKSGFECGMAFENYEDIREKDMIECFEIKEVAREVQAKALEDQAS